MRIESVSFSGIGPFITEHKIDFEALGPDALFLIEGPTGSGKSTILDAITFGIYGFAASDDSDVARLRSNHIPDTQTSWVEVVFATKNAKFKVHREPKYTYAKSNGKGTSERKAVLRVYKEVEPGTWEPKTESVREGEMYLQEQIGLDRNQFSQTVMLPQGQFDKFLKAGTKERQPILEKIFKTQRFKEMLEVLKHRAKSAIDEISSSTDTIREALIRLAGQTRMDDEALFSLIELSKNPEKDKELLSDLHGLYKQLEKGLKDANSTFALLDKQFEDATKELADRQKESDAVKKLSEQESLLEAIKNSIQVFEELIKTESKQALQDLHLTSIPLDEIVKRLRSIAITSEKLIQVVEAEKSLSEQKSQLAEVRAATKDLEQSVSGLKKRIIAGPQKIKSLKANLKQKSKAASELKGLELIMENLNRELSVLSEIHKEMRKIPAARAMSKSAAGAVKSAKDKLRNLQTQLLENYAVVLAHKLKKGEPCQVCGSKSHPKKATHASSMVTEDQIELAELELEKAQQKSKEADTELRLLEDATSAGRAKNLKSQKDIKSEISKTKNKIKEAKSAAEIAERLELELESLEQRLEDDRNELEQKNKDLLQIKQELKQLTNGIENSESSVAKNIGSFSSVSERKRAIDELITHLDKLSDLLQDKEKATVLVDGARKELAALPRDPRFGLINQAQEILETLGPQRDEALTLRDAAKDASEALSVGILGLQEDLKSREQKIASSESIVELAEVAASKNPLKMDLPTYVLHRMFEDVLVNANARLEKVLDSRYRFEFSEKQGDMRSNQGLDISIIDSKTEKNLSPKALSGGEGFSAALALALGLSDAVRANQGGISIDTFFVDEGFGSLDANRLDQVIRMLTQLRSEGRRVGLVSHVESMKNDFEEKIIVTPINESGASTLRATWSANI